MEVKLSPFRLPRDGRQDAMEPVSRTACSDQFRGTIEQSFQHGSQATSLGKNFRKNSDGHLYVQSRIRALVCVTPSSPIPPLREFVRCRRAQSVLDAP